MQFNEIIESIPVKPYFRDTTADIVIYCGDCRDILPKIPDKSIDLVLTDPPYGLEYQSNWGSKTINLKKYYKSNEITNSIKDKLESDTPDKIKQLINDIIPELIRLMIDDSEIYWFCGGGGGEPVLAYAWLEFVKFSPKLKVKNLLVWDKQYVGLGWDWRFQYETIFQLTKGRGIKTMDTNRSNVIRASKIIPQANEHPTPKSEDIINKLLLPKSFPNDVILDPFLGSGTTAFCTKKLGRKCIGIEIKEKYCEIAAKRCSQSVMNL